MTIVSLCVALSFITLVIIVFTCSLPPSLLRFFLLSFSFLLLCNFFNGGKPCFCLDFIAIIVDFPGICTCTVCLCLCKWGWIFSYAFFYLLLIYFAHSSCSRKSKILLFFPHAHLTLLPVCKAISQAKPVSLFLTAGLRLFSHRISFSKNRP